MRKKQANITFSGHDQLRVEAYTNFSNDGLDYIQVEILGLMHPLLAVDIGYVGAETKNPQLREAVNVISRAVGEWFDSLKPGLKKKLEYRPLKNLGIDTQDIAVKSSDRKIRGALTKAFNDLVERLEALKPDVEVAIVNGSEIKLSDPTQNVRAGLSRAYADMRSNMKPGSGYYLATQTDEGPKVLEVHHLPDPRLN